MWMTKKQRAKVTELAGLYEEVITANLRYAQCPTTSSLQLLFSINSNIASLKREMGVVVPVEK